MQNEIVVSGFGGQGVLFGGQLLAYTAMDQGMQVTWIPSYGPEMCGGTANCTVIIAEEEIGSPLVKTPGAVVAMNLPSLLKYEHTIKPGGVLVMNTSMVDRQASRPDIIIRNVPGNELAEQAGNTRSLNMVMVGALIKVLPIFPLQAVIESMTAHTPSRNQRFLEANIKALQAGFDYEEG